MAKRESRIGPLFKLLWRVVTIAYAVITLLLILVVPLLLYFALFAGPGVTVEKDVALVWAPVGNLTEQRERAVPQALAQDLLLGPSLQSVVRDLVMALDRAATDPRIELAFLKLDALGHAQPGQVEDLTAAIERFKQSGKKVIAWSPTYNQTQYRLAAHADKIYLDPLGHVFLQGFGVYRKYFAEAIDKLGIQVNVFRVGEYKSFVEPFIRNDMSPEARAANRAWLESLWQSYREGVAQAQDIQPEKIKAYTDVFAEALRAAHGQASQVALAAGLVDELATLEQVRDQVGELVGMDPELGSFRQINQFEYLQATADEQSSPRTEARIGLVVVEGPIVVGEGGRGAAGGKTIAKLVRQARRDEDVAALLLRINSPGGSVFASERIRRQVALTRAAGKPVVVSMAGVAASGGYWIGMNADQIWAQPSTITGSIGVFGIFPTFGKSLDKIGINTDGLGTTGLSGALRLDMPLGEEMASILQTGIEFIYERFIEKVAAARGMEVAAVDRIAQGRVWSGADAARFGLVDKLGGLVPALAATAELAGLQPGDYEVESIRPPADWRSLLLEMFSLRAEIPMVSDLHHVLGPAFNWLLHGLNDPRNAYAHCFCELAPPLGAGF